MGGVSEVGDSSASCISGGGGVVRRSSLSEMLGARGKRDEEVQDDEPSVVRMDGRD